jgi:acyl-CoA hydrolase
VNVFVIIISNNNQDNFNAALGGCMMTLCVAKALICAMEIEADK